MAKLVSRTCALSDKETCSDEPQTIQVTIPEREVSSERAHHTIWTARFKIPTEANLWSFSNSGDRNPVVLERHGDGSARPVKRHGGIIVRFGYVQFEEGYNFRDGCLHRVLFAQDHREQITFA